MLRTLQCSVVALLAPAFASAQVFYASDEPSPSGNWRFDVATGVSVGPQWINSLTTGLADDDAAQVFYICYAASLSTASYAGTGSAATLLGTMTYQGASRSLTGLAFNNGVLYGSHNSTTTPEGLYAIDVVTLGLTLSYTYTNPEIALEGLDFDPATGLLYGANDGAAYVDPQGANGRGVVVIDLSQPTVTEALMFPYPFGENDLDGLAFDPAGVVYLIEDEPAPMHNFDVATGTYDANPPMNAATSAVIYSAGTYTTGQFPGLGVNYCAAVANSTGATGRMSATGNAVVAANNVILEASDLPNGSFGFFLTSRSAGFVANPGGSQGNLCLSGSVGRFVGPGQIQNSGTIGAIQLAIDLTSQPTPTGLVAVQAGETWNFTAWYRDVVSGSATSNFADGLEITFQ
ncbi:MAG: hypothetical protein R3F49_25155 [Planctomycetota bacterium]